MWDLIVSVPDHCLSFYFMLKVPYIALSEGTVNYLSKTCRGNNHDYSTVKDTGCPKNTLHF